MGEIIVKYVQHNTGHLTAECRCSKGEWNRRQHNKTWHNIYLTYIRLLKNNVGRGFPQGVHCCHVNFVGKAGEDLGKTYATTILVVRIFLHLQWTLVVSGEESEITEVGRDRGGIGEERNKGKCEEDRDRLSSSFKAGMYFNSNSENCWLYTFCYTEQDSLDFDLATLEIYYLTF